MYFSSMFSEAKSNVIDYFGEKIYNCYFYDLLGDYEFNIEFLSSKDDLQCIVFVFSYDFIGNIYLNGVKYDVLLGKYKSINVFESVYGSKVNVRLNIKHGKIGVCNGNVHNIGTKKTVLYAGRGHAMKISQNVNDLLFECNSNEYDKSFTDLTFLISDVKK